MDTGRMESIAAGVGPCDPPYTGPMAEKKPEQDPGPRLARKVLIICIALLLVAGAAMQLTSSGSDDRWVGRLELIASALLVLALFGAALARKKRRE